MSVLHFFLLVPNLCWCNMQKACDMPTLLCTCAPILSVFRHDMGKTYNNISWNMTHHYPLLWGQLLTNLWKVKSVFLVTMSLMMLTHSMYTHTHLSRLCFFPLLFFFSLRVGEELPNLLMERNVCMPWLQNEPRTLNSDFPLITVLHRITPQWGSLLAKMSSSSSSADSPWLSLLLSSVHPPCLSHLLLCALLHRCTFSFTCAPPVSLFLLLLLTLSNENGRLNYDLLITLYRCVPASSQLHLMACPQKQNNWNFISQNHCVIILSMRLEKKRKWGKNQATSSLDAIFTHRLLRRPDFFFFLFFGRGDGELLDFLFTLNRPQTRNER